MQPKRFSYLGDQSWLQITREERFYCSHLYHSILGKEKEFVKWLNTKTELSLDERTDWEISFEVCFYRDFLKSKGKTIIDYNRKHQTSFSQKRTFDLCLFSNRRILIIEAKVQQGFTIKQIDEIKEDKKMVVEILKLNPYKKGYLNPKVDVLLLYSERYRPRNKKITEFQHITWDQLHKSDFEKEIVFEQANSKYKK